MASPPDIPTDEDWMRARDEWRRSRQKKVLIPIAQGTEETEAVILASILRRAGAVVTIASVEDGLQIVASRNVKLEADILIAGCKDGIYDLVVLPGGMPGSERLRDCNILKEITQAQASSKRLIGGISAAPPIALESWGLLKNVKATCHPLFREFLSNPRFADARVLKDGNVTTSRGPGTAMEFALSLVEQLYDDLVVKELFRKLVMRCPNADEPFKEEHDLQYWTVGFPSHVFTALVPVATGSEEVETVIIVDVLRRAGVHVVVASVETDLKIVGTRGVKIVADKLLKDVLSSKFDIVIIPGGFPGAVRLAKCEPLVTLLRQQMNEKRVMAAICAAPVLVLQAKGLLKGKKATAHPSLCHLLADHSAEKMRVVIDGLVATSRGPGTAIEFVLAIVEKLCGRDTALAIAGPMLFPYA